MPTNHRATENTEKMKKEEFHHKGTKNTKKKS